MIHKGRVLPGGYAVPADLKKKNSWIFDDFDGRLVGLWCLTPLSTIF